MEARIYFKDAKITELKRENLKLSNKKIGLMADLAECKVPLREKNSSLFKIRARALSAVPLIPSLTASQLASCVNVLSSK